NSANSLNYMLYIKQSGSFGYNLESPTGDDWEQWVTGNGNLMLYANGYVRGTFNVATGAYASASDARLKTDIQPMTPVLDQINQLKPTTYHFKTDGPADARTDAPLEYGFLAQDVEKVFPSLVSHHVDQERGLDAYLLNYGGFGTIAIKGIQELQQTIQDQRQEITSLEERLATLETALKAITFNKLAGSQLANQKMNGVLLEQNHPNNFDKSTTIRYAIPADANAYILLFDSEGNLVKSVKAPASGKVELSAGGLKTGVYVYTLMVNGEPAASRRLVVAK
ncbi:MAG TPA: tail fiber domain-containing protein, partial [Cytophagales bacterium]